MILKRINSVITILFFLNSCDYRISSKDRFEEVTGINLKDEVKVIEDRFEELGPDYSLIYKVLLSEKDCIEMVKSVQELKDWIKDENNWQFYKTIDGIIYNIIFSIDECQISYNEDLI